MDGKPVTDMTWRVVSRDRDNQPFTHGLFIPDVPEPVMRINRTGCGRFFYHGLGISTAPAGTEFLAEAKAQAEAHVRGKLGS